MENGQSAEPLRVKHALEAYGAPADVVAEMVEIAKDGRKRGAMRRRYDDVLPKRLAEYYELEDEADTISLLEGEFVPGLVQIKEYARALIASYSPHVRPEDVDRLLDIRMTRQQRVTAGDPLKLRILLGEAALHTQVGGPRVLREQLEHLLDLTSNYETIETRVLPWVVGARPALGRNFTILEFPDPDDPAVIFAESVSYFVLEDEDDEVAAFQTAYNQLWELASDGTSSARLIEQVASVLT
ncbi:DUF5753 domain-containing protein [Amycolatopsis cihanbeyliensis]|uniref:DUF5753 domain-containing protein n=1 Tax=Amycolatopsis cihanbeyliensis TaxID=1128664 RepID=A0A542DE79_AMYCI|nr:DUF5753 domain-containing protein [Amycolatopsis cihanbeyliensis]TQJ01385.1 hypothetical protein FB471_1063 [Amycolatopsis cihanbeyliensis]